MPTQRTINSTLNDITKRVAEEGIRPPAVVVIGDVVAVAAEIAGLTNPLLASASAPPLAKDTRQA